MSMEARELPQVMQARFSLAWTAYLRPLIFLLVAYAISRVSFNHGWRLPGTIVILIAAMFFMHRLLLLRSLVLFTDEHGVWVYSGIFPWSRGVNGVKWRDLEDAVYFPGFFSWMFKSYSIRVGHRFTRNSEISLKHVFRGDLAVEHINRVHKHMLAGKEVENQE